MRLSICNVAIPAALALSLLSSPAKALDPSLTISQYKQSQWKAEDGLPGAVTALAQSRNGYLWIGARTGLYRFDGITFEAITLPGREPRRITALLATRAGDVWIGYATNGGVSTSIFRDGVVRDVPMPDSDQIMDFVETPDGVVWAALGRKTKHLMRFQYGRWREVGSQFGFPDENPGNMISARNGDIWVSTDKAVWCLKYRASRFLRTSDRNVNFGSLAEDGKGNIWLSDLTGSRVVGASFTPGTVRVPRPYPVTTSLRAIRATFDRDGNLWGKTSDGIYRISSPKKEGERSHLEAVRAVEHYRRKDGLTSDVGFAILEDREGNIWVGTEGGLDRFRSASVVTEEKLTKRAFWGDVLLTASDGTVFVGEANAVYRIRPFGSPEAVLRVNQTHAICEGDDGTIWIVTEDKVIRLNRGRLTTFAIPVRPDLAFSDCITDPSGRLWIAADSLGIFTLFKDKWEPVTVTTKLRGRSTLAMLRDNKNRILISFDEKVLGAFPPLGSGGVFLAGFGEGSVHTLFKAQDGIMFAGDRGVGWVKEDQVYLLSPQRFPFLGSIRGIAQTKAGETWLSTGTDIVRLSTKELTRAFTDPNASLHPIRLDARDGVPASALGDTHRGVVQGGDGRLWFATRAGTVWIDPTRLTRNAAPPPVAIGALKANGASYLDPKRMTLPAGTRNIEIGFAALSLAVPDRVRLLYMLQGADAAWVSAGSRRQAFYTNLEPGHYSFRVIAANNDGVWNRRGAVLEFDIPPTFLQSTFFKAICALAIVLTLWLLYLARVQQITTKMRFRLEERLAERERIARDLHDTLLQGFQGLIMRFQSVANEIPEDHRARRMMEHTLDSADEVLSSGRDSVRHLRASAAPVDLAAAFSEAAERLRCDYPAQFVMVVEGTPRALHPVVLEEAYRIASEALINAFRHAQAVTIELAITYLDSALAIGVRDDGKGIEPEVIEQGGRQGHFGLVGMRERSREIDAELSVASRPGGGTEVRLSVPGRIAYSKDRHQSGLKALLQHILPRGGSIWQKP